MQSCGLSVCDDDGDDDERADSRMNLEFWMHAVLAWCACVLSIYFSGG